MPKFAKNDFNLKQFTLYILHKDNDFRRQSEYYKAKGN